MLLGGILGEVAERVVAVRVGGVDVARRVVRVLERRLVVGEIADVGDLDVRFGESTHGSKIREP